MKTAWPSPKIGQQCMKTREKRKSCTWWTRGTFRAIVPLFRWDHGDIPQFVCWLWNEPWLNAMSLLLFCCRYCYLPTNPEFCSHVERVKLRGTGERIEWRRYRERERKIERKRDNKRERDTETDKQTDKQTDPSHRLTWNLPTTQCKTIR